MNSQGENETTDVIYKSNCKVAVYVPIYIARLFLLTSVNSKPFEF